MALAICYKSKWKLLFNKINGENKMKKQKQIKADSVKSKIGGNKILYAIALVLLLTVAALMQSMPFTNAAVDNRQIDTHSYIEVSPNPVGVGQTLLVSYKIEKLNPAALMRSNLFTGFTVTITKPDGTTETKANLGVDSTSTGYITYSPTQKGTYTFKSSFAGQWVNGSYTYIPRLSSWANVTGQPLIQAAWWFKPSESASLLVTVQADPIPNYPNVPLPTGYWTRPINSEDKGWWQVADNWLMESYDKPGRFFSGQSVVAPFTSAPGSAHILWTKPITFGGIGGGQFGDKSYYTGLSYEELYKPLILNGRIIYAEHGPTSGGSSLAKIDYFGTRCLDLYNGQEIWYLNNTRIDFAQVLDTENPNEHGLIAYLWSTSGTPANGTWQMFDGFTGRYILTVTNITWALLSNGVTTFTYGRNGEILAYSYSGSNSTNNRYLTCWNSTLAIGGTIIQDRWSPAIGSVIDGRRGIEWNVSIPDVPGSEFISWVNQQYIFSEYFDFSVYPNVYVQTAYDLSTMKRDASGNYPTIFNHLWTANRTDLFVGFPELKDPWITIGADGVYAMFSEDLLQYHGYDIRTGRELWVTDPLTSGWASFTYVYNVAYGKLYGAGYDGHLRAYNVNDGSLAWDYYFGSAGYETPYGVYPVYNGFTIADHKIYVTNDEHTPDANLWRGGKLYCIDADTGVCLWNMSGWLRIPAISDGILTALNALDNQIYTIGKGPSATTVSAPQAGVMVNAPVMISGTVKDQSPGQKDTPCISDADQSAWMEYIHMQKPMPQNAMGVPVKITAYDPNGNYQELGTVMSDDSGSFGMSFTPQLQGSYQIRATFEGSNSYGGSYATAYMVVGAASAVQPTASPTATPTAMPTEAPTATPTVTPSVVPTGGPGAGLGVEYYIAIAAVIIIIAVVAVAIILRRRK